MSYSHHQPHLTNHSDTISERLLHFVANQKETDAPVTVEAILNIFRHRGFGFFLMIFSAVPALPLPAVLIASILSLPIFLVAIQLLLGRNEPWIPVWLAKKTISGNSLKTISAKLIPFLQFFERFAKPRLLFMTSAIGKRLLALCCIIFTISIALPIPFSNTVPSMGVFVIGCALLERDGILAMLGTMIGTIGICITIAIYTSAGILLAELAHWLGF